MKKELYFKPYIHHCKNGNHFHLVTGSRFGASPAFVSQAAAKTLLRMAVDPKDQQDVDEALRITRELEELKFKRGNRKVKLPLRQRNWEENTIAYWSSLIRGELRVSTNVGAFHFFLNTPCDFIERTMKKGAEQTKFSLRCRTVTEVQAMQK